MAMVNSRSHWFMTGGGGKHVSRKAVCQGCCGHTPQAAKLVEGATKQQAQASNTETGAQQPGGDFPHKLYHTNLSLLTHGLNIR
jgi:hypothetical protein